MSVLVAAVVFLFVLVGIGRLLRAESPLRWRGHHMALAALWLVFALVGGSETLDGGLGASGDLLLAAMVGVFLLTLRHEQDRRTLAESEATYRLIVNTSDELIYQMDLGGRLIYANRAAEEITGHSLEDTRGHLFTDFIHPDDAHRVRRITLRHVFQGHRARYTVRMITRTGEVRDLDTTVVPLMQDGRTVAFQGVARDVTNERRAMNQAQFLGNVITESNAPIMIVDEDGRVMVWNRGMEKLTGRVRSRTIGLPYDQLLPDTPDLMLETAAAGGSWSTETMIPTEDEALPVRLMVYRVGSPDKPSEHAVFVQDLSRQRRLEEQVMHHERMEALGKLASGVAHDFNNILTIIAGNATVLQRSENLPEGYREHVQGIIRTSRRGAELTAQLLSFSRRRTFAAAEADVTELIGETVELIGHADWSGIRFETSCEPNLPRVYVDMGRIQQVLMNLCVNARDAMMPEGGVITLRARQRKVLSENDIPRGEKARPGLYVALSVSDTGQGISPEDMDKVFEPFFTTKGTQGGTGLGLANVHGIVQQHGGWVEVASTPGAGSTFTMLLPSAGLAKATRSRDDAQEKAPPPPAPKPAGNQDGRRQGAPETHPSLHGRELVLFADNEELMREVARTALEMYGYNVLTAGSARELLERIEAHHGRLGTIVLDWSLEGEDGAGLIERVRDSGCKAPVIVQSGRLEPAQGDLVLTRGADAFIAKPYMPEELMAEIRRLLDGEKT